MSSANNPGVPVPVSGLTATVSFGEEWNDPPPPEGVTVAADAGIDFVITTQVDALGPDEGTFSVASVDVHAPAPPAVPVTVPSLHMPLAAPLLPDRSLAGLPEVPLLEPPAQPALAPNEVVLRWLLPITAPPASGLGPRAEDGQEG